MIQGKCNLLKPVDCTTGTFFMFSQTAQDLTREFTQADSYRVVPSKLVALDLDLSDIVFSGGGSGVDWDTVDWLPVEPRPEYFKKYKTVTTTDIYSSFGGKRIMGDEIFIGFPSADFGECSIPFRSLGAGAYFSLSEFADSETSFTIECSGVTYNVIVYYADGESKPDDSLTEKTLGHVFQNYFENSCTHIRSALGDNWKPDYSLPIFWKALQNFGLIKMTGDTTKTSDNIKWIGDINIYSYNPTSDGIGYSEVYCYIPNDAKATKYDMHQIPEPPRASYPIDEDEVNIHGYKGDETATYTGLHWMLEDPVNHLKYFDEDQDGDRYYSLDGYVPDILNYIDTNITDDTRFGTETSDDSFTFNAVLVMYDIVSKANDTEGDRVLYHNVPMGIYFTGKPVGEKLTNEVVKFVSHPDIYDQGTSYGLRICSRFLCSPNLTKFETTEVTSSDNADDMFTKVLSKMAENEDEFNDLSKEIQNMSTELVDHMANFRNNKVNVPYLRNLNGTYYWFVNGKNTGVPANSISKEEVDALLERMSNIENNLEETIWNTMRQMSLGFEEMSTDKITNAVQAFVNILNS